MRWKMDSDVDPCDDFYRFSCGGFQERYKNATETVDANKLLKDIRKKLDKGEICGLSFGLIKLNFDGNLSFKQLLTVTLCSFMQVLKK